MPTPFESAQLNLQLFDLRREPLLREARAWVTREFNPESFEEVTAVLEGEQGCWLRMVYGYWDMAASMVTMGAIDAEAFRAAHTEIYAAFSKLQPFLGQLRTAMGLPELFGHTEAVVMGTPDAQARLDRLRTGLRAAAKSKPARAGVSE
jgi:hypothetical protein